MLFAKVGIGQTFILDPSFNSYPTVNCDQAIFLFENNTINSIWYRLEKSDDDLNWTDISEAGSAQRVLTSNIKQINVSSEGFYRLKYYNSSSPLSFFGTSVSIRVNVKESPFASNVPTNILCFGNTTGAVNLTVAGGTAGYNYLWSNGATSEDLTTLASGTYSVTVTDAKGCTATSSATLVSINPLPTVTATSTPLSGAVCIGDNATLNGGGAASYTWSGGVTNGTAFAPTTTTTYTVTGTDANGCVNTATKLVTVTSLPTAAPIVASDNKVIENKTLNLTAAASGGTSPYNFTWTPNSTINYSISGQQNAVFNALKKGKVNIKYQVKDANNCEANSADFEITIESEQVILIFPNAFTPNGDNNNDIFKIASSNMLGKASFRYFEIYNRNGKLMHREDNIIEGWDGKYKDIIQDMGVYFVKLVKVNDVGQQVVENAQFYLLK